MKNQKLNLLFLLIALVTLPNVTVSQEYSTNDFNLNITGLSKEYENMFSKYNFISLYNKEGIEPKSLKPIELNVNYSYEVGGVINLVVNYNNEDVFSPHSRFTKLNQNNKMFLGNGVSIFFLGQIFNVLQKYKLEILQKYRESRIMYFFMTVTLQTNNGNKLTFIAAPNGRGYSIYNLANLKYDNQEYEIYSPNSVLSKQKFFKFGKKTDLSGTKTGFYYMDLFFSNELQKESKLENSVENRKGVENYVEDAEQIMAETLKREELLREGNNISQENSFTDNKKVYRVEYKLSNRSAVYMERPYCSTDYSGIIIVQITVDQNGNVTEAVPDMGRTTIKNSECWEAAQKASLNAEFNKDESAPKQQAGTITYQIGGAD